MATTIEKHLSLSKDRAERLHALAEERGETEDALVERALDILFSVSESWGDDDRRNWGNASETALGKVWDNPADARYDNWKELYGVS